MPVNTALANEQKKAAKAAYMREYYRKNAETIKAKTAAWVADNKERAAEYAKTYHTANAEKKRDTARKWATENKARKKAADSAYYTANKDARLVVNRQWKKDNKELVYASNHARSRRVRQATPAWADLSEIRSIYLLAAKSSKEVDHIVPIKGKTVCGLHVVENLRLIGATENRRKGNSYAD